MALRTVDVIDTMSQARAKSIPTKGGVHNTYVTPDGKYVIAGSIVGKNLTVIDVQTEQPVWSLEFDLGVRPMAFEQNADGSTKRIFFQLSDFHPGPVCSRKNESAPRSIVSFATRAFTTAKI